MTTIKLCLRHTCTFFSLLSIGLNMSPFLSLFFALVYRVISYLLVLLTANDSRLMNDSDLQGNILPQNTAENTDHGFIGPLNKKEGVVHADDEAFIKKIFETDPRQSI